MKTEILLNRIALKDKYTIGKVSVNTESNYICDSLEDPVRDKNNDGDLTDPGEQKIWGDTAIPIGYYPVEKIHNHPHFGDSFRVYNVPSFDGIFIHAGNYPKDTHGCPLMGYNTLKGAVMNSRPALNKLFAAVPDNSKIYLKVY